MKSTSKTSEHPHQWINQLQKKIRAYVILSHLSSAGLPLRVVCFSCGNSIRQLRDLGIDVAGVGPNELLRAAAWHSFTSIANSFNGRFDATSGHLPLPLMVEVSKEMRLEILRRNPIFGKLGPIDLPTGSGETFVCLQMAFPELKIIPVRGIGQPTVYNPEAPLNNLVQILSLKP